MALQASIKKFTPPGSIINGPPIPPLTDAIPAARVERILRAFRDYREGAPPRTPWTVFKLSSEEYEELLDRLQHDELLRGFVEHKIRYDYDPIQSKFVIRMLTTLHASFVAWLVKEIEKKLERLADIEIGARPFIEGINPVYGELKFLIGDEDQQQTIKHEPDASFKHKDAAWPGIVIELAYSQKRKSLVNLADNYILGSDGNVNVMVGLDLDYKKSKQASISIWRMKNSTNEEGEVEGEVEQLFRDAEGNPVLSSPSSLELFLKDFAIEKVTQGVPDSSIVIDSGTLCKLLDEAEECDNQTITMEGAKRPRIKRKWRLQTPPEQLTLSDEENYVEDEQHVRRKLENLDGPYAEESVSAENSSQNSI